MMRKTYSAADRAAFIELYLSLPEPRPFVTTLAKQLGINPKSARTWVHNHLHPEDAEQPRTFLSGHTRRSEMTPEERADVERRLREYTRELQRTKRTFNQIYFGDPLPSRSALAAKRALGHDPNATPGSFLFRRAA
jgi:transposase-like protein